MAKYLIGIALGCLILIACEKTSAPLGIVPTPEISPLSGTYLSTQTVTIDCALEDVIINYTLDGTDPTSQSSVYSTPLQIAQATTVKSIARKKDWKTSQTAVAVYYFLVSSIYLSPESGTFNSPQYVTIYTVDSEITVHYTLDGTEPSEISPVYASTILIDCNTVLKARGYKENWIHSEIVTGTFEFETLTPDFSQAEGLYYNTLAVALDCQTPDTDIRYTIDDSDPTENSALYAEPVAVNHSLTLKARAFKTNWNLGQIATSEYELKVTAPSFTPLPATFTQEPAVTIFCPTPLAAIRFTTNGSDPDAESDLYTNPVTISANTLLKAKAFRAGWTLSNTASGNYNLQVSAPSIAPPGGSFAEPQTVTLSCPTPGAQIRYTLDNTTPTENSILYQNPILISTSKTIIAKTFKTGWNSSSPASASFTIIPLQTVSTPVFDPAPGEYGTSQSVSISCATQGAVITYTTDGSEPTSTSLIYMSPINVYQTTTFKAKGFKTGWNPSPTAVALYNINIYHEPLILVQGGTFSMGCTYGSGDDDEFPVHQVTLSPYYISNHEVRQDEYSAITGSNPSQFNYGPEYPVDNVCFFDAVAYCNLRSVYEQFMPCYEYSGYGFNVADWPLGWNTSFHNNIICHFDFDGYRLPTEAEWEYAARGGMYTNNYNYAGSNNINTVAWYGSNSNGMSHPVGQKAPNELGLYDMSGNLWEICWDWYGPYQASTEPVVDPQGPPYASDRVFRGGMWQAAENYARVANRSHASPSNVAATYGFRVVRSIVSN